MVKLMKRSIVIDGETYESIRDFCESIGTRTPCVKQYARLHNISIEEACLAYKHGLVKKREQYDFEINGEKFTNFSKACKHFGFYVAKIIRYAQKNNVSNIEALKNFVSQSSNMEGYSKKNNLSIVRTNFIVINGIQYISIVEACSRLNVSYSAVMYYKKHNNCSIEEAINYYLNNKLKTTKIIYNGKFYNSIKDICEEYNLSYNTIMQYKKIKKCSTEQMLEHYIGK